MYAFASIDRCCSILFSESIVLKKAFNMSVDVLMSVIDFYWN